MIDEWNDWKVNNTIFVRFVGWCNPNYVLLLLCTWRQSTKMILKESHRIFYKLGRDEYRWLELLDHTDFCFKSLQSSCFFHPEIMQVSNFDFTQIARLGWSFLKGLFDFDEVQTTWKYLSRNLVSSKRMFEIFVDCLRNIRKASRMFSWIFWLFWEFKEWDFNATAIWLDRKMLSLFGLLLKSYL